MKRVVTLLLTVLLAVGLTACGEAQTTVPTDCLGTYTCTNVTMDNLTMSPEGKWLTLNADGTASTFLTDEADEASWKLSGTGFTMTVAGKTVGTGTLEGDTLTLDMAGITYTFLKEGAQDTSQEPTNAYADFTCYGGLYTVRYPTARFREDPAGFSDLYAQDGSKGWITKLDSKGRVEEWLTGFEEKANTEGVQDYRSQELTVAGYPAQVMIYQDADGWHSEILVNFGKDLGTKDYPMYAACLTFTGSTYGAVWDEEIQAIVESLTLPET